jgi:hypothetical protein
LIDPRHGYTKATFGVNETAAFKTGIAKIAGVTVDKVTVTVADARRHLLAGVKVELYRLNPVYPQNFKAPGFNPLLRSCKVKRLYRVRVC